MTLAQVLARIEPTVVLPPLLGAREGSLNTVGALIGYSGTGKGLAYDASWQVFHWAVPVVVGKFGSGEGLVDLYASREKDPADKTQWIVNQHTTRAIVYTAEITTLRALLERSGSTLLGGLCEVYSGEGLGFYRNREKGVQIPDHSYRASLAFGVQPANADTLLAAVETGLPQRVCWWPATVADPPAVRPDTPAPLTWAPPLALRDLKVNPHTGRCRLPVCTQAAVDVDAAFVRRCQQGKLADPLASHDMQTRLKLAAALTFLLRGVEISEEVWQLSGVVAAISTGMRSEVCADLAEAAAQRNRQRGQADGQRAVAAKQTEAAETEAQIQRVAPKILKHLTEKAAGRWITRNTLRSGLRSADRLYFDGAVDHLVGAGMVTQRPVAGTGQPGVEKAVQS